MGITEDVLWGMFETEIETGHYEDALLLLQVIRDFQELMPLDDKNN